MSPKESKHEVEKRKATEYKRRWRSVPHNWQKELENFKRYYTTPHLREKIVARQKSNKAARSGKIIKLPCEICGNPNSEAHHKDYSKPLDVQWFCKLHHVEAHKKEKGFAE